MTVIIPYRNDPDLKRTIDNLRELKLKYIVVNDCSHDRLGDMRNLRRMGVGASIDRGVKEVKTKYFCILGSDVIFLKGRPEDMILGEQTISCSMDIGKNRRNGADILLTMTEKDLPKGSPYKDTDYRSIIDAKWRDSGDKIPCVLGACYVINTEWYRYLRGFEGHRMWGTLEPYLCLKAWLAGGDCRITDVKTNHVYGGNNYTPAKYLMYNKLLVAYTVLFDICDRLDSHLGNNEQVYQARQMIDNRWFYLEHLKDYYQSIFTRTTEDVFNEFKKL